MSKLSNNKVTEKSIIGGNVITMCLPPWGYLPYVKNWTSFIRPLIWMKSSSLLMQNYFQWEKKWMSTPLRKRWRILLREKCCVIVMGPCWQAKGVMGRVKSFLLSLWHCVCLLVLPRSMHRPADSVISAMSESVRPPMIPPVSLPPLACSNSVQI